ncbi:MAG: glyoxalase [Flammeovirgaceae bacterium]|nr:glyoxalase [Flammeovirgaceae bacterium]|tara:strand:+ start:230 stop:658 length:429 start_codon:yes stop_codon:yes gene_type:complete
MSNLSPFHLAIPVKNLIAARTFYRDIIQCTEGRSDTHWVDFNFYGHQLVIHEIKQSIESEKENHNSVDGHQVPIPHFGIVLEMDLWKELSERLKSHQIDFLIEPYVRFEGQPGEQATMFFKDPSGNALEFKAFKNLSQLFAK